MSQNRGVNGVRTNGVDHGDSPAKKRLRAEASNGFEGGRWSVKSSKQAHRCVNPVRSCEEKYFKEALEDRDKSKKLIKLSVGEWAMVGCLN
jgi:predicted Co/Zn/Cd cation transporter (cation efflux family)